MVHDDGYRGVCRICGQSVHDEQWSAEQLARLKPQQRSEALDEQPVDDPQGSLDSLHRKCMEREREFQHDVEAANLDSA